MRAGSAHRKFTRQIFVSADIDAPLYWWKEFDTYKVGTVANSTSTMHRIHAKPITFDDFETEGLNETAAIALRITIDFLEFSRKTFVEHGLKEDWESIIKLLPCSYKQLRTVSLNYEVIGNIYSARRNHKLREWHVFCDWAETLPYAAELIMPAK